MFADMNWKILLMGFRAIFPVPHPLHACNPLMTWLPVKFSRIILKFL